jgi:hypothetical protein
MKITKQLILPLVLLFMLAYARGQDSHYNYDRGELSILSDLLMDHAPELAAKGGCPGWLARFAGQPAKCAGRPTTVWW